MKMCSFYHALPILIVGQKSQAKVNWYDFCPL